MDVQPKPGSDSYFDDLCKALEEAEAKVLAVGSLDCDRAETQIARAVAMQRMYEIKALLATEEHNSEECRKCGKMALEYSTQQTRAKQGRTDDRLARLTAEVGRLKKGGTKLRAV